MLDTLIRLMRGKLRSVDALKQEEKPKVHRIITDSSGDREAGICIGTGQINLPKEVGYIKDSLGYLTFIGTIGENFRIDKANPGNLEAVIVAGAPIFNLWNMIVEDGRIYSVVSEDYATHSKERLSVILEEIKKNCGFDSYFKKIMGSREEPKNFKCEIGEFSYDKLEVKGV